MKKLIIINQEQSGYNNATYYYCKYLKKDYAIVYIGWDNNLPKIKMKGIKVIYVSRKGNILFRTMRFLRQTLQEIKDKTMRLVMFMAASPDHLPLNTHALVLTFEVVE